MLSTLIFDVAYPADHYQDDIGLGDKYRSVTEFKSDAGAILVQHTPTEIIESWSIMNGPNRLRASIEKWVDDIHGIYPPE